MRLQIYGTDDYVTWPIYELDFDNGYLPNLSTDYYDLNGVRYLSLHFISSDAAQSQIFPETIPKKRSDDGSILTNNMVFVLDANNQYQAPINAEAVQVGMMPSDWNTQYWKYYTTVPESPNYIMPVATVNNEQFAFFNIPQWSATAQYYAPIDTDYKKWPTLLLKTDNGCTFGLSGYNYSTGYQYTCAENPQTITGINTASQLYYWHIDEQHPYTGWENVGGSVYYNGLVPTIYFPGVGILTEFPATYFFVHVKYNDDDYFGVCLSRFSGGLPVYTFCAMFNRAFWGTSIIDGFVPSGNWGEASSTGGGDGTFTAPSDDRGSADGSDITNIIVSQHRLDHINDVVNNGGFNVYQLRPQIISEIIGILYGSDYFSRFVNAMYNPLSAILAYQLIPSRFINPGGSALVSRDLTAGGYNISQKLTNPEQFPILPSLAHSHIGAIDMVNFFGAFPDFAPYTTATLHLPYIGVIDIDINTIARGRLAVDYICDLISGNVAAWVWVQDRAGRTNYLYTGTGNAAFTVPLYSQSADGSAVGKIIGGAAGLVAGAASDSVGMIASGALSLGSGLLGLGAKQTHGIGTYSGNVGMLTDTMCFLHVQRPKWVQPEDYQMLQGIPSGISGTLAEIGAAGRTVCQTINTEMIPATEPELQEIERLLKSGIYINR